MSIKGGEGRRSKFPFRFSDEHPKECPSLPPLPCLWLFAPFLGLLEMDQQGLKKGVFVKKSCVFVGPPPPYGPNLQRSI